MKVVVTGYTGLLGRSLIRCAPPSCRIHGLAKSRVDIHGVTSYAVDLCDANATSEAISGIQPDIIINCAAEGSVDKVEGQLQQFRGLNVEAASRIAQYARGIGATLVHVSSNAVYGDGPFPLREDTRAHPLNDYGKLKLEAEQAVTAEHPEALIIRPILLYGWPGPTQRPNPVVQWIRQARNREGFRVVDDVLTQPLAAVDCAEATWRAITANMSGILNISGGQTTSLYDFARLTMRRFLLPEDLVLRASSSDFPGLAPRPHRVEFDLSRLNRELDFHPMDPETGLDWLRASESHAT